ncbi:methyltransferase domain-containing protein [Archangium violaceum]|nr:methyltransferase domain-containing protein [Archangium violaceum]
MPSAEKDPSFHDTADATAYTVTPMGTTDTRTEGARRMWGLGDYTGLAGRLMPASQALIEKVEPVAGRRVLDVAAGTGNAAWLAAERGAQVTACDLSPRMVQLGRERTGARVEWLEANAEDLPLPAGSFDVALSAFGVIFVPRPEVALAQLRRVLVPGGVLALTAWTNDGVMARMTDALRPFFPPSPTEGPDSLSWGKEAQVRSWLSEGFTRIEVQRRTLPWHFDSPAQMTAFLKEHSPIHVALGHMAGERAGEMFATLERMASPEGGPVRLEAEYLLVSAVAA